MDRGKLSPPFGWRGAGAVDRGGLENRPGPSRAVPYNPERSAFPRVSGAPATVRLPLRPFPFCGVRCQFGCQFLKCLADLTDDDKAALAELLCETIEGSRFLPSPRIRRLKAILDKLDPPGSAPSPGAVAPHQSRTVMPARKRRR